jgi:2-oxoglutarate dehydrogenase E1 component
VALATAKNMDSSLSVPTATSLRTVNTSRLESFRLELNEHRQVSSLSKVSFTHIIAFALTKAAASSDSFRSIYAIDDQGAPIRVTFPHVNLGVAVDVPRPDGTRQLMVPVLHDADTLSFDEFVVALDALFEKARTNKLTMPDLMGATLSLTNPGTVGTISSQPRLMEYQSSIIGVGAFHMPSALDTVHPARLKELGVSRQVTVTSTYDHRVIQGAESGRLLGLIADALTGSDGLFDSILPPAAAARAVVAAPSTTTAHDAPSKASTSVAPSQFSSGSSVSSSMTSTTVRGPLSYGSDVTHAVVRLIDAYVAWGHTAARTDPLESYGLTAPTPAASLDPAFHGLSDLSMVVSTPSVSSRTSWVLSELVEELRRIWCGSIGFELSHIEHHALRAALTAHAEASFSLSDEEKRELLASVSETEGFERFLQTKYTGQKRFGIEGSDVFIAMLQHALSVAASRGVKAASIGMPHRGRLAVLSLVAGKPFEEILRVFEGHTPDDASPGSGDVKYHLGFESSSYAALPVALLPNPSHLETVTPLVLGHARAWSKQFGATSAVLPIIAHGDAAFAGQGVVAESFVLSGTDAYETGGALHIIVNNQVGFTTSPRDARSTRYASDVVKGLNIPVLHVNADDPEAALRAIEIALDLRERFSTDVVIDLVGYRRNGHNEGDDPSMTQPVMYRHINGHPTVRTLYAERLIKAGVITSEAAAELKDRFQAHSSPLLESLRHTPVTKPTLPLRSASSEFQEPPTAVAASLLETLIAQIAASPDGSTLMPKVQKVLAERQRLFNEGSVDWSSAELLSLGSLLSEGVSVRLTGEDVRRGTFSQRHVAPTDAETGVPHSVFSSSDRASFEVYDSVLSEYAAVGFETGYVLRDPSSMVLWEAQFGDFANTAQVIIDQYIAPAREKWGVTTPLVMLLPHGFEGQGPEHSSARIERFLQLSARECWRVAYPTTAAQYFHLLRLAALESPRRPLVVFTPKQPLRMKETRSLVSELSSGSFHPIIISTPSDVADATVKRVVLCSGKVAWDLIARRDELVSPAAVVRVESLYPFPAEQVAELVSRFSNASDWVWAQEEPENMGAASYVSPLLASLLPTLRVVARSASPSPATGFKYMHDAELHALLGDVFDL